ncbi:MAG: hypothetical protein AABY22_29325 [Nanoarchaeota archaeon]
MSLAELEVVRSRNREAMGLSGTSASLGEHTGHVVRAGLAGSVPGLGDLGLLDLLGPVHVGSAFPAVDYRFDPSQPSAPPEGEGSAVGEWLNRHVIRPFVQVGPVRYAPGDGYADYSAIARLVAWLVGLGLGIGTAWILARAFFVGRAR